MPPKNIFISISPKFYHKNSEWAKNYYKFLVGDYNNSGISWFFRRNIGVKVFIREVNYFLSVIWKINCNGNVQKD